LDLFEEHFVVIIVGHVNR